MYHPIDDEPTFDPPHAYARLEGQPCSCPSRYYGGDCAHTTSPELEEELAASVDAYLAELEAGERERLRQLDELREERDPVVVTESELRLLDGNR